MARRSTPTLDRMADVLLTALENVRDEATFIAFARELAADRRRAVSAPMQRDGHVGSGRTTRSSTSWKRRLHGPTTLVLGLDRARSRRTPGGYLPCSFGRAAVMSERSNKSINTDVLSAGVARLRSAGQLRR